MRVFSLAIAFAALCGACRDNDSLRGDLGSTFPDLAFADLDGVRLGMTAKELETVRPNSVFNPYAGRGERINGTLVGYAFPPRAATESSLREDAELSRVSVVQNATSYEEARSRWDEAVGKLTSRHGPPVKCERLSGESSGIRATWHVGEVYLEVAARRPLSTGPDTIPDRLIVAASLEPPPEANAEEVACASDAIRTP